MIPPKGHKLTPRSTPLHVFQLIMLLLKETFAQLGDSTYPYRTVAFDTTYNKESLKTGTKPLIVVSCGDVTSNPIALQDIASGDIRTFNTLKTTMVGSSVVIKVISPNKTEVEIISNEVFNFLTSVRVILPKLTTILQVSSLNMTQVNKVYRDLPQYYIQCSMSYVMQYLWTHIIPQTLLESAVANINIDYTPVGVRILSKES